MKPTVELNGKQYDAMTGKLLRDTAPTHVTRTAPTTRPVLDMVAPKHTAVRIPTPKSVATTTAATKTTKMNVQRIKPHHVTPHQPQHATTLMRQAVQHPKASFKRQTKVTAHTGALVKNPKVTVVPKHAITAVDQQREQRAHHVRHSDLVRRFNTPVRSTITVVPAQPTKPRPIQNRPGAMQPIATRPVRAATVGSRPVATAVRPSSDIFERALERANSHKQPPYQINKKSKKSRRIRTVFGVAFLSLILVAAAGVFTYKHSAAMQLRLAQSRAGIHATMPEWYPNGFDLHSLDTTRGAVTLSFLNSQTSQQFSVTQTASNLTSDSLLNQDVLPNTHASYDTIQSAGNTIYTYGNNDATWVTNGILYRLTTNGVLSTSQIVQFVANM